MLIPYFDNSYARLPDAFYARQNPVPVSDPRLVCLNQSVAEQIGFDVEFLSSTEGIAMLAGNQVPAQACPLAMAYAGHQFGGWAPQLGDGRAILLGEVLDSAGTRFDVQLKGAGRTPFSRGGDGRAWLGPVMREYLVSEAMHALGVPTTRSLAAIATGEHVFREGALPGALLVRVARSHIRVGTFEYFLGRGMQEELEVLLEYVIERFYPAAADSENKAVALLDAVSAKTADLIAKWQSIGFIHGVMNTDNMNISGETIDYGPCAFMDQYSANKVFSSIDAHGRYAYQNQPGIAQWNMAVLAQCLLPLMHDDEDSALSMAQECIDAFPAKYESSYNERMANKLGIDLVGRSSGDKQKISLLSKELLISMETGNADFTLTYNCLSEIALTSVTANNIDNSDNPVLPGKHAVDDFYAQFDSQLIQKNQLRDWVSDWLAMLPSEHVRRNDVAIRMSQINPVVIPRNHRIEQVIEAGKNEDFAPFHALLAAVQKPFSQDACFVEYRQPPTIDQTVQQTFCGT